METNAAVCRFQEDDARISYFVVWGLLSYKGCISGHSVPFALFSRIFSMGTIKCLWHRSNNVTNC